MIVTKISKTLAVIAATAVVGMPALVDAQAQATNQPVAYGADSVEYAPNCIILRGRAEATQGVRPAANSAAAMAGACRPVIRPLRSSDSGRPGRSGGSSCAGTGR